MYAGRTGVVEDVTYISAHRARLILSFDESNSCDARRVVFAGYIRGVGAQSSLYHDEEGAQGAMTPREQRPGSEKRRSDFQERCDKLRVMEGSRRTKEANLGRILHRSRSSVTIEAMLCECSHSPHAAILTWRLANCCMLCRCPSCLITTCLGHNPMGSTTATKAASSKCRPQSSDRCV
jgi:hypothetical protein